MESREQPSDSFSVKRTKRLATLDHFAFLPQSASQSKVKGVNVQESLFMQASTHLQQKKSKSYSERIKELA